MKKFLVVGTYVDNGQRYADTYEAKTPAAAEKKAMLFAQHEEGTQLMVAAVFEILETGTHRDLNTVGLTMKLVG